MYFMQGGSYASEKEVIDPPYPINYKRDTVTQIKFNQGKTDSRDVEILINQGFTADKDFSIKVIQNVLQRELNFPIKTNQGRTDIPTFGDFFLNASQSYTFEDDGTGVIKINQGITKDLNFKIKVEIDRVLGMLVFRGKLFDQHIDDGQI